GRTAETLGQRAADLGSLLSGRLPVDPVSASRPSSEMTARVLEEVAGSFANFRLVATREAELLHELSEAHEVTATVPYHSGHVTDLRGLLEVGARIWGDDPEASPLSAARPARASTTRKPAGTKPAAPRRTPPGAGTSTKDEKGPPGQSPPGASP